jgi:hypothetical protein
MDNPVVCKSAGDGLTTACRVVAIAWYGTTTAADTVALSRLDTGKLLWGCKTELTSTYFHIPFGSKGIGCPQGFTLSQISSGTVLVYLAEA